MRTSNAMMFVRSSWVRALQQLPVFDDSLVFDEVRSLRARLP
jgi:hypothetical protein